ncbi:MAG: (2Fe-2S)-binding protein [Kofleriaceae bacterium]|nr:(2Fe-2S)-binding protein [Kofleriaceae bacterium]
MNSTTLTLNGTPHSFEAGETLLDVATRAGEEIMTLCHDPRLKPVGACRTCLVEIKGVRRLAPSCMTKAEAGMEVIISNERIERHQKALLALYMSDNVSLDETGGSADPSQMHQMAEDVGAPTDWPAMKSLRADRKADRNPYIEYRSELCILCARCTRYCEEVESVSAITLSGRGAATTISTVDSRSLLDTSCELCGGCIDVCPTGAMTEKKPLALALRPNKELAKIRTTCNYCGVGCRWISMSIARPELVRGLSLRLPRRVQALCPMTATCVSKVALRINSSTIQTG